MNTIKNLTILVILITFFSCKNTSNNVKKKEISNSKKITSLKKIIELKKIENMVFYGIEKVNKKWVLNDYCGGGSKRIKFSTNKIFYYQPTEEIPYSINTFNKKNKEFIYHVTSDYSKTNKVYIFEYNSQTGILNLKKENTLIYFINITFLDTIKYIRSKCDECYDKSDCDEWKKKGVLKKGVPFGYPE